MHTHWLQVVTLYTQINSLSQGHFDKNHQPCDQWMTFSTYEPQLPLMLLLLILNTKNLPYH